MKPRVTHPCKHCPSAYLLPFVVSWPLIIFGTLTSIAMVEAVNPGTSSWGQQGSHLHRSCGPLQASKGSILGIENAVREVLGTPGIICFLNRSQEMMKIMVMLGGTSREAGMDVRLLTRVCSIPECPALEEKGSCSLQCKAHIGPVLICSECREVPVKEEEAVWA